MIKKAVFTLLIILFCLPAFAQNETVISGIRKAVEQINKDTGYVSKMLENEEFLEHMPDGGGQLTGYYKKGKLVKMVEWIGLSSCINITEYYLRNNKLIFTYTRGKEFQYIDSTGTFNSEKQDITMECRFYFDNGQLVRSVLKGSTRCGGEPQKDQATIYQSDCLRYMHLFTKK